MAWRRANGGLSCSLVTGNQDRASIRGEARMSQDKAEIEQIFHKYLQSINAGDVALASQVWLHSPDVLVVTPIGRFRGWESVRKDIYPGFVKEFPERSLQTSNVSIVVAGDAAWLVYDFVYTAKLADGKPFTSEGWESHGYQRTADGWRIAHLHYSVPPPRL
jgi:ketosteroid isomerase-like protein